jgi:uncharacterized protein
MNRSSADVIVIGAGLAGLCACLELLDAGREVLLLDRGGAGDIGGQARVSFGGILLVGTPEQRRLGIPDNIDIARADWRACAAFTPEDRWGVSWSDHYLEHSGEDVSQFVRGLGIGFVPAPQWVERGFHGVGNSLPRFHLVWGTGQYLIERLLARIEHHARADRLSIRHRHRVDRLLIETGRIAGCAGASEDGGADFECRAGQVIVASGGINGDLAQVRRHWHRDLGEAPETILNGSHEYADGRVHGAVAALGGRVRNLDRMWNYAAGVHHPTPKRPEHGLALVTPRSGLWLNWRGERFGPVPLMTGYDTRELVARICAEERKYSWLILNRRIMRRELAVQGAEFNPSIRERRTVAFIREVLFGNDWLYRQMVGPCPDIVTADDSAGLVAAMNAMQGDDSVLAGPVERTVRAYDDEIARGPKFYNDEQLRRLLHIRRFASDRLRTCKSQRILDPGAGPLIAIRLHILSRKSLGGIETDLSSRVLGSDGSPVPGLYAAGEAAGFGGGGMNGLRALEGTFLGGAILSGRIAGRSAARA